MIALEIDTLAGLDDTLAALAHCAQMVEAARAGDFKAYQEFVIGVPSEYRHRVFMDNCPANWTLPVHIPVGHWLWQEGGLK